MPGANHRAFLFNQSINQQQKQAMNNAKQTNEIKPLWVIAQSKHNQNRKQKVTNTVTKKQYFEVLEQMKQLYKGTANQTVFERDYTTHPGDKPNSMHCFLTNDFYWHLRCDDDYNFVIHLATGNLPFSQDFSLMFAVLPKSVRYTIEYLDLPIMFKRCKRLQDSKFFTIL